MTITENFVRAARVADIGCNGCHAVQAGGHTLALFQHGDKIYAVDNRCPHMGFPLDRGTVKDGILTCHWHHARFDLASGGTFDPWADDVRAFPVEIRDGEVWVDLAPRVDRREHHRKRLREGLEQDIPLVVAKAVITLLDEGEDPAVPLRAGLEFGARYRQQGWGQGLTIAACMMNLLPHLGPDDRPRALYHGLSAVARECSGMAPHFGFRPLPMLSADVPTLKRWFRQFVEVRDSDGAERCIISAVRAGADHRALADMLFAAATDHRYIQTGHVADMTNKAFEALDRAGWEYAEAALASLVPMYATAERMEEANAWRSPVDLIPILEQAFDKLPAALEQGRIRRGRNGDAAAAGEGLPTVLLGEDPQAIADALLAALAGGAGEADLAAAVSYAAALRIARFHTSNEFGDWDSALHTFTFANAVEQALRRAPSPELLRGVFDAAMSIYLERFLNVPPAPLPSPQEKVKDPQTLLAELPALLDKQQQVNPAGELVARYLYSGGPPKRLLAVMGGALLREDRDFHTIQCVEAAFRQHGLLGRTDAGACVLVAAARYLAAHSPTVRAQGQTYQIARRLHRGEHLFEEG